MSSEVEQSPEEDSSITPADLPGCWRSALAVAALGSLALLGLVIYRPELRDFNQLKLSKVFYFVLLLSAWQLFMSTYFTFKSRNLLSRIRNNEVSFESEESRGSSTWAMFSLLSFNSTFLACALSIYTVYESETWGHDVLVLSLSTWLCLLILLFQGQTMQRLESMSRALQPRNSDE